MQSVALAGNLYWQFGDSFFTKLATDGMQYRANTFTRSTLANPFTTEPVNTNGVSYQYITFTADEKRFNDSTHSPVDRIALWPTGIVSANNKDALVFFAKLHLRPQSTGPWQDYGIGLAHRYGDGRPLLSAGPQPGSPDQYAGGLRPEGYSLQGPGSGR